MRLVAHEPEFREYFQLCKKKSPGKGAGIRALTSVCDKVLRIIYRMLKGNEKYLPGKDKLIAEYYTQQREAA
jgi:hypothetical protein